ncbi:MAG: guanylate kinase [Rhodospirillales bacterium]|nr:MAG: guanylate kinase [Rhodospirillales bacterium]
MGHGLRRSGIPFVLSSPSGAGKTTIARALINHDSNLIMSVSATTRPPRPGEEPGRDYHFMSADEFDRVVAEDGFLERAEVFGNRYGTPRAPVEAALADGRDVLFDVDWQGARQLRQSGITTPVTVFILPPTRVELERRLRARAQDPVAVVEARMAKAAAEMSHYREYDYIVVNRNLEASVAVIQSIITAERHRLHHLADLAGFIGRVSGAAG